MIDSARVQAWFDALPDTWRDRAERIRELLLEASPLMREEWRFKSNPFYYHRKWVAYLALQQGRVVLGFTQGKELLDAGGVLERTDHKVIRHYRPPVPPARMDERALRRLINEAVAVDEQASRRNPDRR